MSLISYWLRFIHQIENWFTRRKWWQLVVRQISFMDGSVVDGFQFSLVLPSLELERKVRNLDWCGLPMAQKIEKLELQINCQSDGAKEDLLKNKIEFLSWSADFAKSNFLILERKRNAALSSVWGQYDRKMESRQGASSLAENCPSFIDKNFQSLQKSSGNWGASIDGNASGWQLENYEFDSRALHQFLHMDVVHRLCSSLQNCLKQVRSLPSMPRTSIITANESRCQREDWEFESLLVHHFTPPSNMG